jgi:hypothetical protein
MPVGRSLVVQSLSQRVDDPVRLVFAALAVKGDAVSQDLTEDVLFMYVLRVQVSFNERVHSTDRRPGQQVEFVIL